MQTFAEKALTRKQKKRKGNPDGRLLTLICLILVIYLFAGGFCLWRGRTRPIPKPPQEPPQKISGVEGPASAELDDPPPRLTINGKEWLVQSDKALSTVGLAGMTKCKERIIYYDFSEEIKASERDTLWHEIGHAIRCSHPKSEIYIPHTAVNISIEHFSVYEMGMGLAPFVHDNPEFMKWAENWKDK